MGETMSFQKVRPSDAGIYFCIGHTNSGTAIDVIHLKVSSYAPSTCPYPFNQMLKERPGS